VYTADNFVLAETTLELYAQESINDDDNDDNNNNNNNNNNNAHSV